MTTPLLELAEVPQAILDASDEINNSFAVLDCIVQLAVLDKDLGTPPASPVQGMRYIIPASATGVWASKSPRIAYYSLIRDNAGNVAAGWRYLTPREGWHAFVIDELKWYRYSGTAWIPAGMNLPAGGTSTQVLGKASDDDYDVQWFDGGTGGGNSACAAKQTTGTSCANGVNTPIVFDAEDYDTDGFHSTSVNPSRITIPTGLSGRYMVSGNIRFSSVSGGVNYVFLVKNADLTNGILCVQTSANYTDYSGSVSWMGALSAGDYIEIYAFQNAVAFASTQPVGTNLSIARI